jgi:hypothetical protein
MVLFYKNKANGEKKPGCPAVESSQVPGSISWKWL